MARWLFNKVYHHHHHVKQPYERWKWDAFSKIQKKQPENFLVVFYDPYPI